ncbi:MAG: hypothetical protein LBS31_10140 [Candidatus Adiutrix sp.]|jgi:hypothetical protein|nr:hypothetical protein [Candidatus Adiutrix sp.]
MPPEKPALEAMHRENMLILAKTYPVPSVKYNETTCVAGINEDGLMRRLFPIQFRFMDGEKQFKKWQWLEAKIKKAPGDHRPESHIIDPESIVCRSIEGPEKQWERRRTWIDRIPAFNSLELLEESRRINNITLALLRPLEMIGLEIRPEKNPKWTRAEINSLLKHERQGDLFNPDDRTKAPLEKIPFAFHYSYKAMSHDGRPREYSHKIIDWEICELYRRCRRDYDRRWEKFFRDRLEKDLFERDLSLLMGTMHRFPDQWLIISLIYPPKKPPEAHRQSRLFF